MVHLTESTAHLKALIPAAVGCFVFVSLSFVALRGAGKRIPVNRLFAAVSFLGGFINADMILVTAVTHDGSAITIDRLAYILIVFGIPLYIRFTHRFLGLARPRLEQAALALSFLILPFTQSEYFIRGHHEYTFGRIAQAGPVFYAFIAVVTGVVTYCLVLLLRGAVTAERNDQKNRMKYIICGFSGGALLIILNILPISGVPVYPPGHFSFIPAIILAYGLLKHDLLDLKEATGTGIFYLFFGGSLAALSLATLSLFDYSGLRAEILAPALALTLCMVVVFDPLKRATGKLVEQYFFRNRYSYRAVLKDVSSGLTSLLRVEEIGRYVADSVESALNPTFLSLLVFDSVPGTLKLSLCRGDEPDADAAIHSLVEPLKLLFRLKNKPLTYDAVSSSTGTGADQTSLRKFLEDYGIELIVPIMFRETLSGVMMLGEKKAGDLYGPEELELLSTVSNQAAVAVTNALTCEGIEKINALLEQKVAQRTADLSRTIEEQERTRRQLVRSESLAAIGELVAGTAHELNNPLAGALSLLESALETLASAPCHGESCRDVLDDLAFSVKELKRATAIIRSLLSLSRQTSDSLEPVDLNAALEDSLRILRASQGHRNMDIRLDLELSLPPVEANFAHLGQAFINILKNAFQSLPERGGLVELRSRYDAARAIARVECRDNGCGIDPRRIGEVCKPFFTTKPTGEGTGLGLYITHEIIRRYGGSFHIESAGGTGTLVNIEFPVRGECHDRSGDCRR
ncbi:MAG: ATP-binding protein [Syntrophales bacterium]|jgi:two-component system NtrC family sensor kinase|nr:ATP-binding protein [Syntrophales bacterium]MCK9528286.1 ATP-binding protein [Syntrophales bacterium]MDX9922418.1 ATP-binding protein [Syntrophales bacterium]